MANKDNSPHVMVSKDMLASLEKRAAEVPLYCENDDCRVLIYVENDSEGNCPGCGRFGRKKGK